MKKIFVGVSLLSVLGGRLAAAEIETGSVVVSPQWIGALAEEARTNHPALRAATLRADAAGWNAAAVRTWEDPTAKFGVMGADRAKRADDGDLVYGVEQKLPLFGKARAARDVIQAGAVTQRHEAAFRALQLRRDLHKQALKIALGQRAVELARDDLAILDLLVTTAEDKYRNGLATQVEVLTSQNERARRANQLWTSENQLRADLASLQRWVNGGTNSLWPRFLLPQAVTNLPPLELIIEHATSMAPQLDVMRGSLREAEAAVRLVRQQRFPDVSLGVEGRQFADNGEFREGTLTLGLTLPWGNRPRNAAALRREQLKAEAAQLEITDMQLAIREEVMRFTVQIENAAREALLYRDDIIPRTAQAVEAARSNWLNNRGSLRDVIETRRMWVESNLNQARSLAEQAGALAELSLHCGLEDLEQLATADTGTLTPKKGLNP